MGSFRVTMLYAFVVLFAMDEALGLTMNTTDVKAYQPVPYLIKDRTSILFQVKACGNVHVLLMANESNQEDSVYEIVFGGWNNIKSVIRKQILGPVLAEDQNPRTACDLFKSFWVDWADGIISLGEGDLVGMGPFLTYNDTTPTPVSHFMISTGWGDTGEWNLGAECRIHGDPHHSMLDGTRFTYGGHHCWFDLLYNNADFFIQGHYEQCYGQRSCVKEISIRYKNWDISLQKRNKVKVNSNAINSFPHITSDGAIEITLDESEPSYIYTVKLPNAAAIGWNGKNDVQIGLGMSFINDVKGLCGGNYNLDNTDDFTLRDGTEVNRQNKNIFGNSWALFNESTTNLAVGKDVSQSSILEGYPAERAIDGCANTDFSSGCCTHTGNDFGSWWRIDLGKITAITRIVITRRWECGSCRSRMNGFRVFVTKSEDTTDEAPAYTSTGNSPGPVITVQLDWKIGR